MNEVSPLPVAFVAQLIPNVPAVVALLVGIALSIARFGRHRRVSVWALTGFTLLLLQIAVKIFGALIVNDARASGEADVQTLARLLAFFSGIQQVLLVIGIVALICAVFGGRGGKS